MYTVCMAKSVRCAHIYVDCDLDRRPKTLDSDSAQLILCTYVFVCVFFDNKHIVCELFYIVQQCTLYIDVYTNWRYTAEGD